MFQERPATSELDTAFVGFFSCKANKEILPKVQLLLHASHEPPQLKLITIKPPILEAAKLSFQIMQISILNKSQQRDQSCMAPLSSEKKNNPITGLDKP